jgi:hypothetical protein
MATPRSFHLLIADAEQRRRLKPLPAATLTCMGDRRTDLENELYHFLTEGTDDREKAADQRSRDLAKVHADGWKSVADAIAKGLGAIADAVRDHGRR